MMVIGSDLYTYYQENMLLVQYGFSLESVMDMIPYEKQIYMGFIKKAREKE